MQKTRKQKEKEIKFMSKIVTKESKEAVIERIEKIIEMYQDISKGYIVRDWVCLCDGLRDIDYDMDECEYCPANSFKTCVGPGGDWVQIQALIRVFRKACSSKAEEILLGGLFRKRLYEELLKCDWIGDSSKEAIIRRARYWTYENIIAYAGRKAKAWKKWLKEFRKVEVK